MREFDLPLVRQNASSAFANGRSRTWDCPHIEEGIRQIWQAGYDEASMSQSPFFGMQIIKREEVGEYRVTRYEYDEGETWFVAVERFDKHWGWLLIRNRNSGTLGEANRFYDDFLRTVKGINA